jgi:2-oxoglutarate ferredoxin oxidoreductase subunit beta
MIFGVERTKGIRLDGNTPVVVDIGEKWSLDDVLVHDESDYVIASLLSNLTYQPDFPDPIGVIYAIDSPTYEDLMVEQINAAIEMKGAESVQNMLNAGDTWVVE